ncbi:hypothetical protein XF24_00254 [candidate division SR1 bacterium Aalborg_AAW-1]|nr:hypothetical protein XF24_00254 [candidate division SR1 bacterium Aalborg_AAW-1]
MSTAQNPNCSKTDKCMHISIIVLLLVAIASSIWSGLQVTKMETLKVGGKENFEKLQTIMKSEEYKAQYAQSLDLMLQQLNGSMPEDTYTPDEMEVTDETITDEVMTGTTGGNETLDIVVNPSTGSSTQTTPSLVDSNETVGE